MEHAPGQCALPQAARRRAPALDHRRRNPITGSAVDDHGRLIDPSEGCNHFVGRRGRRSAVEVGACDRQRSQQLAQGHHHRMIGPTHADRLAGSRWPAQIDGEPGSPRHDQRQRTRPEPSGQLGSSRLEPASHHRHLILPGHQDGERDVVRPALQREQACHRLWLGRVDGETVDGVRGHSHDIAVRQCGGRTRQGRCITRGQDHLAALAKVLAAYGAGLRKAIGTSDKLGDEVTADLFTGMAGDNDKNLWLVEAHLQADR